MKKQFNLRTLAALMMAAILPLTACGNVGLIDSDDGPTGIYIGDNEITLENTLDKLFSPGGTNTPDVTDEPEETSLPEDDPTTAEDPGTTNGEELPYEDVQSPGADETGLDEDGTYNSVEDVSLYLHTYGRLPDNYITKSEAQGMGWTGGPVDKYAPGCAIGGDTFGNREGILPAGTYHECDIDTIGGTGRGAKRIVYSDDGRIYYTEDHYETFTLLYGEE